MRGTANAVLANLQTVYNLADILADLALEKPTDKLLEQIRNNAIRIKKITKDYNE